MSEEDVLERPAPSFTVDSNVDPEAAYLGIAALKRVIRMGKIAERALRQIQTEGFCDARVPTLSPQYGGYRFEAHRFTKRPVVTRKNMPDPAKLQLSLGKLRDADWSGHPCKEAHVFLTGPQTTQIKTHPVKFRTYEKETEVGYVRLNKNHLSWWSQGRAHRVYKEIKYAKEEDLISLGEFIANQIIRNNGNDEKSAMLVILRQEASKWLVEDGHVQRWMQELRAQVPVLEVMEA